MVRATGADAELFSEIRQFDFSGDQALVIGSLAAPESEVELEHVINKLRTGGAAVGRNTIATSRGKWHSQNAGIKPIADGIGHVDCGDFAGIEWCTGDAAIIENAEDRSWTVVRQDALFINSTAARFRIRISRWKTEGGEVGVVECIGQGTSNNVGVMLESVKMLESTTGFVSGTAQVRFVRKGAFVRRAEDERVPVRLH